MSINIVTYTMMIIANKIINGIYIIISLIVVAEPTRLSRLSIRYDNVLILPSSRVPRLSISE